MSNYPEPELAEGFPEALQREVMEELGVRVTADFILRPSHFYRGEPVPENEMVGVMYACTLEAPESIQLSWEHSESRWVTPDEAAELFPAGHWLPELIQRTETMRSLMSDELLEFFHTAKI